MIVTPLPNLHRLTRQFHLRGDARQRFGVDGTLVDLRGRIMVSVPERAEQLAERLRRSGAHRSASGAELLAAGLLDEAMHLFLSAYAERTDRHWRETLEEDLAGRLGGDRLERARAAFVRTFPPASVAARRQDAEAWLHGHVAGEPARLIALEERLLVHATNRNPALEPYRFLMHEDDLGDDDAALIALAVRALQGQPGPADGGAQNDLWSALLAPVRAHPHSLAGQLAFVRNHWAAVIGEPFSLLLERTLLAGDMLAERHAGGPPGPPPPAPVFHASEVEEPEAFSADADWMANLTLVAKNAFVWMAQLSERYGREIDRLDGIPDEALKNLVQEGFSGLWLIGLWERSRASQFIKRRRGDSEAVASAYSLDDYVISERLGGEEALTRLRERAATLGLRLAADMVPNHVGIDSRWVIEHPERLLSLDRSPYPGYRFSGPDLSHDSRVQIRLEDGYWDGSDAAVVFERKDRQTGDVKYVYHGNDGTSMPWNDTAQIDYLNPQAREAVIRIIVDVARRFPIIRFDAAMTLASKHIRRLWYPNPGEGGAIPSRGRFGAMSDEAFQAALPVEFWREVVDRVAREAPNTLLLAEAFWMMEGYFVRSLGMHRVYNSAFMNMLAREDNAGYQTHMRNVLASDPRILARFVNFMNNPDEETARKQFGDGDKAFGVTVMMATLPGLPMFGHGQVDGLTEKYGMEFERPKFGERPDAAMRERHMREVAPLLRQRERFAGTERFRLLTAVGENGNVEHDVFAYVNGRAGESPVMVLFHNRFDTVSVRLRSSVPMRQPGHDEARGGTLLEALAMTPDAGALLRFRDVLRGHEFLVPAAWWQEAGATFTLQAYEARVLDDFAVVEDQDGSLTRLAEHLAGRGVPSLSEAAMKLQLAPVHDAFTGAVSALGGDDRNAYLADLTHGPIAAFERQVSRHAPELRLDRSALKRLTLALPTHVGAPPTFWRHAWALAASFEAAQDAVARLRLDEPLRRELERGSVSDVEVWLDAWHDLLPSRQAVQPWTDAPDPQKALRVALEHVALAVKRKSMKRTVWVHTHEGVRWFHRERFHAWRDAYLAVLRLRGYGVRTLAAVADRIDAAEELSEYRWDAFKEEVQTTLQALQKGANAAGQGSGTTAPDQP
jgi:glycosidase